ncbi:sigma-70 family RNA polymerase sigma factor [Streptomyces sp. NPDC020681]|uniref:sigma-70 family RNA polymerase sigma factor n=1 Tax=Streptomyces sp. NPDC020681 TaxID=3365083 RepID=UPI0037B468E9
MAETSHDRWQRAWSHREQLLKVARRRSMSAEDAEDAVHEAMLRAAENPHLDDERLGAWLTTVTMRLCVDRYRQVNREAEVVRSSPTLVPPGPVPVEEAVCDRAEAKWLAVRSGELPARQAQALWLKSQDLDVDQVAVRMGLSYRTVESLLARARRTLRNSLAGTLGLALWLCSRGRPRTGGNAHAVAVAGTAATLAIAGFVVPYAQDWARPGSSPEPAAPAVSEAAEVRGADDKGRVPPPAAPPGESATQSPGDRTTLVPLSVPSLPSLPSVPEVPLSAPDAPDVPDVPEVPAVTSVPELSVPSAPVQTTPPVPLDVPDPRDTAVELPGDAAHTRVQP